MSIVTLIIAILNFPEMSGKQKLVVNMYERRNVKI